MCPFDPNGSSQRFPIARPHSLYGGIWYFKFRWKIRFSIIINIEKSRLSKIRIWEVSISRVGVLRCAWFFTKNLCILNSWIFDIFHHDNYDYWKFGILKFKNFKYRYQHTPIDLVNWEIFECGKLVQGNKAFSTSTLTPDVSFTPVRWKQSNLAIR